MIVSPVASPKSTLPFKIVPPVTVRSPVIPAFSSTVRVSIFAVPSMNKSWNSFPLAPRSLAPSEFGKISPPTSRFPFIVVIPAIETPPCS